MPSSESTPLLNSGAQQPPPASVDSRGRPRNAADVDDGLPMHRPTSYPNHGGSGTHPQATFVSSLWWFVSSSWMNVLLVFVPLGILAEKLHWGPAWTFGLNFLAIIPLAKLLGDATEQAAIKLGSTLGGLLNATFGNAVELLVAIVALSQGQLRIVQTSLIGSILSNILLVLGCSFIAGGITRSESNFQQTAAQASGSIMTLGCITLAIPAAFQGSKTISYLMQEGGLSALDTMKKQHDDDLLFLSRGTSIILLIIYVLYLIFQLKTHNYLFEAENAGEEEEEVATMTPAAAVLGLLVVTVVTGVSADYLVGSIDDVAREFGIPTAFLGLIALPIVGNAAEHVTSVWMATKGKMEVALGVAIGSSVQIAIGVVPTLVLIGWAIGQPLTLYFQTFETVVLVASVILVNTLIQDGKSNFLEGASLVGLYLVAAISFWVSPE